MPTRRLLPIVTAFLPVLSLAAGEAPPAGGDQPPEPPPPEPAWTHELKLGAFLSQSHTGGVEHTRDPIIAGTKNAVAYQFRVDAHLTWKQDLNELRQELRIRYGRVKEDDGPWEENADEIRYDVAAFRFLEKDEPTFLYAAGRGETVFTGPDRIIDLVHPDVVPVVQASLGPLYGFIEPQKNLGGEHFTPAKAQASVGVGQRYENFCLPKEDRFEWRFGVRAQRRWDRTLPYDQRGWEVGLEAVVDYRNKIADDTDWFLHGEAFAPFDDLAHITAWGEAGLDVQVNKYLTVVLSGRIYYETHPKEIGRVPNDGYDEMSWGQAALIGLTVKL